MLLMRIEAILGRNYIRACRTVKGEIRSESRELNPDSAVEMDTCRVIEASVEERRHRNEQFQNRLWCLALG
jgi:hypothetical protein